MPRSITRERFTSLLEAASARRVAVGGDAMRDVYRVGDGERI
jgi:hypothetical protein